MVKQQKWRSKYLNPGLSCDYSAYGSDHPLCVVYRARPSHSPPPPSIGESLFSPSALRRGAGEGSSLVCFLFCFFPLAVVPSRECPLEQSEDSGNTLAVVLVHQPEGGAAEERGTQVAAETLCLAGELQAV